MSVALGIGNEQEPGFLELFGQLIGQSTRNPSGRGAGSSASILSKLIHSSLSMFFSTDNNNLPQVRNGCNDSGGELDFSVGLIDLEDVVAGLIFFLNEFFHAVVDLVGAEVDVGGEEGQDVALLHWGL